MESVLSHLHTLFGDESLTPDHLKAVMADQGFAPPSAPSRDRKQEQEVERMRCVRQLLRAEETVLSLQHALRPPGAKPRVTRRRPPDDLDREAVGRLLAELELLFFNPNLFGSLNIYTQMNALKGKVLYFHNLLMTDRDAALRFIQKDLAATLAEAPACLRAEINRRLA